VQEVFDRWDLHSDVIGQVTDDGLVRVRDGERVVAEMPAAFLSQGFPEYQPPLLPSAPTDRGSAEIPFGPPADLSAELMGLLGSSNLASRRAVFEQYDHMVQTNTVVPPGEGAAVMRLKGTSGGLALGLGVNPRVCQADPWQGGAWVVAEACRNVACAGARPIALTDCLNFGDPERPSVWAALAGVAEGMREACLALDVPIISGNVSLYNETEGAPIAPTPVVGALGLIEHVDRVGRAKLAIDQTLWLIGPVAASLGASEYAARHGWEAGAPASIDLDLERRVQSCVRELIAKGMAGTATDVSEGGVAVALAELGVSSQTGVQCGDEWVAEAGVNGERVDAILFGEAPSRVIAGTPQGQDDEVQAEAARWNVPCVRLGVTGGSEIRIGKLIRVSLDEAHHRWATALEHLAEL
jgi:phosphoribosylformylglycinamidine synthase subunit PurL